MAAPVILGSPWPPSFPTLASTEGWAPALPLRPDAVACPCGRNVPATVLQQVLRYERRTGTPLPFRIRCRVCGSELPLRVANGPVGP